MLVVDEIHREHRAAGDQVFRLQPFIAHRFQLDPRNWLRRMPDTRTLRRWDRNQGCQQNSGREPTPPLPHTLHRWNRHIRL
jgi:hypothetical protein